MPWTLLAAIGRVESDHGRFAGATLYGDGISVPRVIGIPLNGVGTALISDTDRGRLDGDLVYDRAVGPMQFIPSTWANYATDGNGDGHRDPFNIFDAASAAAHYLCTAGGNLRTQRGQTAAVLAYNHSDSYLTSVLTLEATYAAGGSGLSVPVPYTHPLVATPPTLPPVDPGRPQAIGPSHRTSPRPTSRPPISRSRPPSPSPSTTKSSSCATSPAGPTSTTSTAATSGPDVPSPTVSATDPTVPTSATPSATDAPSSTAVPSASPTSSTSANCGIHAF